VGVPVLTSTSNLKIYLKDRGRWGGVDKGTGGETKLPGTDRHHAQLHGAMSVSACGSDQCKCSEEK
jgi:hypothetical protein